MTKIDRLIYSSMLLTITAGTVLFSKTVVMGYKISDVNLTATRNKTKSTAKYTYKSRPTKKSTTSNVTKTIPTKTKVNDEARIARAKEAEKQVAMRPPWDNGNVYESVQELDSSGVNENIRQMSRDAMDKKLIYINLSKQQYTALEDGNVLKQGSITSGRNKFSTIQGEFQIWDKKFKSILRAPTPEYGDYELPVDYWMPFHKGYGLHDAWWRSKFGGSDYTYNGSHGCVNMQFEDARWVFEWSNIGTTVFVSK